MKMLMAGGLASLLITGGCVSDDIPEIDVDVNAKTSSTYAVVIGMEDSKFAGACPGSKLDSNRMYALLSKYAQNTLLLQDKNATRANVKGAIEGYVEKSGTGLFILYYSGHGGSEPFPDTGIEEDDGMDEYLCLYDSYMRDNEIWSMISRSKGRVLIITDSCHSKTQFRTPAITLAKSKVMRATSTEEGCISMQCWSGCPDNAFSYGSSSGGQFTNSLFRHFDQNLTYDELWKKIEQDSILKMYETVQRTLMGKDFKDMVVFR